VRYGNPDKPNRAEREVDDQTFLTIRKISRWLEERGHHLSITQESQRYYGEGGSPCRLFTVRLNENETLSMGIERELEPTLPRWSFGWTHYVNGRSTGEEDNVKIKNVLQIFPAIVKVLEKFAPHMR
jgi:hypothetical protein